VDRHVHEGAALVDSALAIFVPAHYNEKLVAETNLEFRALSAPVVLVCNCDYETNEVAGLSSFPTSWPREQHLIRCWHDGSGAAQKSGRERQRECSFD